jgi:hypothetical protein
MRTQCTQESFEFHPLFNRQGKAGFNGGAITSDGGGLLLREVEKRTKIVERFAACFGDHRGPGRIEHTVKELVGQRVYALALGYEDLNDHDELRQDPLLAVLAEKADPLGESRVRERDRGKALAGKSTLNRLELTKAVVKDDERYKKIVMDAAAVDRLLVEIFLEAHATPPPEIVLDLDATDDPVHGNQEGRFFHGYYGHYCYLPLYIFCGDFLLCARLRPSNIDASAGCLEEVERIVAQIRQRWPEVKITIRGDSGFCREELMSWCETHGVDYVLGLAKNERLKAEIAGELEQAAEQYAQTGQAARAFKEFTYQTRESWWRARRVIAQAEHLEKGSNPRFAGTTDATNPPYLNYQGGDAFGGVLAHLQLVDWSQDTLYSSIARFDGATGQETWRYSSPSWLDSSWAVRSDGTIFAVENTNDFSNTYSPNFAVALVGIDGATGVERLRVPIPPSRLDVFVGDCSLLQGVVNHPSAAGPPMVGPDGSVFLEVYVWTEVRDSSANCTGSAGGKYFDNRVLLLQIAPDGTPLWSAPINSGATDANVWAISPGEVIPDGQGGLLASWIAEANYYQLEVPHLTHITAAGNSDYALPFPAVSSGYCNYYCSNNQSLVLGENGTAFATDGHTFASFDITSGAVNWSWTASTANAEIIAATAGNGLVVNAISYNSGQQSSQVVRLDPTGVATYDTWTGNSIQYAFGDNWLSMGTIENRASGSGFALAAGFFPTLFGYFGSNNSEPRCAPIEPAATKKLIEDGFSAVNKLLQTPCAWCKTNIFDKLKITQSDFANYLGKGHQFCDGTKSREPGTTIKQKKYATVADYFAANKGVKSAITASPYTPFFSFFDPAYFQAGFPDYQKGLVFHEALIGWGFSDGPLCLLIPDATQQNQCYFNQVTDNINIWLEENALWPAP